MTYFPDLSPYTYTSHSNDAETLNIGWLDIKQYFPKGNVSNLFLERLWLFTKIPVIISRGFHICQFCDGLSNSVPTIQRGREKMEVGFAELRIFGKENIMYAAPDLLYHYVETHNYLPPQEFIDALLTNSPPGSPEHQKQAMKYSWGKELYKNWDLYSKFRLE